jgi:hypothetical protein
MHGAVQLGYRFGITMLIGSGVVLVAPSAEAFHFKRTRFAAGSAGGVWMNAICEPSRESTMEVTTDPPVL